MVEFFNSSEETMQWWKSKRARM